MGGMLRSDPNKTLKKITRFPVFSGEAGNLNSEITFSKFRESRERCHRKLVLPHPHQLQCMPKLADPNEAPEASVPEPEAREPA